MSTGNVLLSAGSVYGVDHGAIYFRGGESVAPVSPLARIKDVYGEILARGILAEDFAVFTSAISSDGAADIAYLVTKTSDTEALLVPASMVEADARRYGTPELAHKFQLAGIEEISHFGLASLYRELERRFPLDPGRP